MDGGGITKTRNASSWVLICDGARLVNSSVVVFIGIDTFNQDVYFMISRRAVLHSRQTYEGARILSCMHLPKRWVSGKSMSASRGSTKC